MNPQTQQPEKKLSIKEWAAEDRPREKLLLKGTGSLSDAELIAILIRVGNKNETAVELAKRILNIAGNNINELGKKSITDLTKLKGIGLAKAISIIAALELGRRRKLADFQDKKKIACSKDVFDIFQPALGDLATEEFWILLLNQSNRVKSKHRISQGGLTGTVVDIRVILQIALENKSVGIILCHNHPSGNITPSNEDIKITSRMKEAAASMDISLLDHMIITDAAYYSFADEGKI
ncbi:MAG: DNA repair protein RadC [Bacteroidia bacterium]|nr:DNA repair protein RadC [Bacteroidia bacterium]